MVSTLGAQRLWFMLSTFHPGPLQSVENAVCVLRNLSYRLYDEMPPSALQRLEGRGRRDLSGTPPREVVGCFTPQSRRLHEVGGWSRECLLSPLMPPPSTPQILQALRPSQTPLTHHTFHAAASHS